MFRGGLIKRLDALVAKKLVLIVAPPGYGKSVLLAEWAGADPSRRIAWLTLETNDDANTFAGHSLRRTLCG